MKKTLIAAVALASTMATPAFASINTDSLISKIDRAYNAYGRTITYTGSNGTSAAAALTALIHAIDNQGLASRAGGGEIRVWVDQDGHLGTNAGDISDVVDTVHQFPLGDLVNALVNEINTDFFRGIGSGYIDQEGHDLRIPTNSTEAGQVASTEDGTVGFAAQSLENILTDAYEYNTARVNRQNTADEINQKKADFVRTFGNEATLYNGAVDAIKEAQKVGTATGHGYETYRLRWRGVDGRLTIDYLGVNDRVPVNSVTNGVVTISGTYDSYADFVTTRASELRNAQQ